MPSPRQPSALVHLALFLPWAFASLIAVFLLALFGHAWLIWLMLPLGIFSLVSALAFILRAPLPTPIQRALRRHE
jgi:hypothetical protein